jgi:hypothetical protein
MNNEKEKTHYRKAFNSPYLSSADIVGPTVLTIANVSLSGDQTKKTKDVFNTAHFVERELRHGEPLKPMILNAHNSKILKDLTGSHFIDDWNGIAVTIYVDSNVRFGRDTVEGLRLSPQAPVLKRQELTKENTKMWAGAVAAYKRDGNIDNVTKKMIVSDANAELIKAEASNV